jgi:hypothetical protein
MEITDRVVVVVEEGGDPGDEGVLLGVEIKTIPEDQFGLFGLERREAIPAS